MYDATESRDSGGIVQGPYHPALRIEVLKGFFLVPDMVARGYDIGPDREQLVAYFFRDANFSLTQMTHVRFDALLFGCILKLLEPYFCSKNRNRRFIASLYFVAGGLLFISFIGNFNKYGWFSYTLVYSASGFLLISALTGFTPLKNLTENGLKG